MPVKITADCSGNAKDDLLADPDFEADDFEADDFVAPPFAEEPALPAEPDFAAEPLLLLDEPDLVEADLFDELDLLALDLPAEPVDFEADFFAVGIFFSPG